MSKSSIPAVVPGAGKSQRMGQPKLLLQFEGEPLIGGVVRALCDGGAGACCRGHAAGRFRRGPCRIRRGRERPARR